MKRFQRMVALFLWMFCISLPALRAQTYGKLWAQAEQARQDGLLQTALGLTEEIYRKALHEKNIPQLLQARVFRDAYREQLIPDSLYFHLRELENWVQTEPDAVCRAMLHSLLACDYADYLSSHYGLIRNRTVLLPEEASEDIRQWSGNLFIDRVDAHNRASLADSLPLLAASAQQYAPFVVQQEGSRFYGHDLYHLLANRAADSYRQVKGYGADSLAEARTVALYAALVNAYRHRPGSEDAVVLSSLNYYSNLRDSELRQLQRGAAARMSNVLSTAVEAVNADYLRALDNLIQEFGERPVCAEVYIDKVSRLRVLGQRYTGEALRACNEALKRYPAYKRIAVLKNAREELLRPSLSVHTESSIYPGDSLSLLVQFRNLTGFTLNVYRTDLSEVPWMDHGINQEFYRKHATRCSSTHFSLYPRPLEGIASEEWCYQTADTTLRACIPAETGVYILQVVPDAASARADNNFLVSTRLRVLTLSLPGGQLEAIAVDSRSGHPVAGAALTFYSTYNEQKREEVCTATTDADGKAVIRWDDRIRSYVARKGNDRAMTPQSIYGRYTGRDAASVRRNLTLLTDRSLYRPGQTLYVKGIAYTQQDTCMQVLKDATYEVQLLDANRKEIARKELRTNEFGSFTTEFTLPTACLNGMFTLRSDGATIQVRVEAYKRPTFDITFQPLRDAYRIGDTVHLSGNVRSYSGVALQDAMLTYTVTRQTPFLRFREVGGTPLTADTLRLDAEGNFSLPVTLAASGKGKPVPGERYAYWVEVAVTGSSGETQMASYVLNATDQAYFFVPEIDTRLCKEDTLAATLAVTNAAHETLDMKGTCRLYPLTGTVQKAIAGAPVYEGTFRSGERKEFPDWRSLPSGEYRLILTIHDKEGREVSNEETNFTDLLLFSATDTRPATFQETFIYEQCTEFDAIRPASVRFGTSFRDAYVWAELFGKQGRLESRILQLSDSIMQLTYPYKEEYGDGVSLWLTFVKNGHLHSCRVALQKRLPSRTLDLKWEVFRDRLRPGQEEEWKLVIRNPQGIPAAAEVLALMYDASLDRIYSRSQSLQPYFHRSIPSFYWSLNYGRSRMYAPYFPVRSWKAPTWQYDYFRLPFPGVVETLMMADVPVYGYRAMQKSAVTGSVATRNVMQSAEESGTAVEIGYVPVRVTEDDAVTDVVFESESFDLSSEGQTLSPLAGLRTNFAETAFFYPQLRTNEQGEIAIAFTLPQSLTRWNFCAYAHTQAMLTGQLNATAVTSKEFMLMPNLPRFVRVGDRTQLAATVANLTDKAVKGTVTLTLFDPQTEKVITTQRSKFTAEAGQTAAVSFRFDVTDRTDLLGVRIVADGGSFSDGEQHLLPVLSNCEYITETVALPIRGNQTRTFSLDSLFNGNSRTATHRHLTIEFTGNPAWYAIQSLPSLSNPVSDNALAWATAFYANTLAGFVAASEPRIRTMVDNWQQAGGSKETFLSRLATNQELKEILLEESPWLMDATTESEQQARIATLFDVNLQADRQRTALFKLKELQAADGTWSWFKGMSGSHCITAYIVQLLSRLPLLTGAPLPEEAVALRRAAFESLHRQALETYRTLRRSEKEGTVVKTLPSNAIDYLYLLALSGEQLPTANEPVRQYFLSKLSGSLEHGSMTCKARVAFILAKAGRQAEADKFIASLKEHLVQTDERGAFFAFHETPYTWGMLPVPAHVEVMQALRTSGGNETLLEEMRLWLLKQKQTTQWNSPVATADAIYALFSSAGNGMLEHRGDVRITLGNRVLETLSPSVPATASAASSMAGLGYLKESFPTGSPELKARSVTVEKRDAGIAWGAVYAQYLSPTSDVKQQGSELKVEKQLYVERTGADGSKWLQRLPDASSPSSPVAVADCRLQVGDKIVSRLVLTLDRAMDFVQLKDRRAACFEPVSTLSGYRWGNGFGYYTEVEDASTNFFFDHLGRGVYVLEHSCRIDRAGTYETGLATAQCAYAPEYAAHSTGGTVDIR